MIATLTFLQRKKRIIPIEIITSVDRESTRFVDVAYLQSLPENRYEILSSPCPTKPRHAIFQIASNFNGIEPMTEQTLPDTHNFVTNYYHDRTQGPAASISCGAGAIFRAFAPFYSPTKNPSEWQQTKDTQVSIHISRIETSINAL